MEPVLVSRVKLIKVIEDNREKHVRTFKLAEIGWRKKQVLALQKFIQKVQKAKSQFDSGKSLPGLHVPHLVQPVSFKDQYDQVLGMLKLSIEENVKLDASDFQRYVKDKWEWSGQFAASTVGYAGGGGGGGSGLVKLKKKVAKAKF